MKRLATLLAALMLLTVVGVAPVAAAVNTSPDVSIEWPGSEADSETYWENYFDNGQRTNVACTKYNHHSGNIPAGYEAIVIKHGQMDFIWYSPEAGQYLGPSNGNQNSPGLSHIFKCNWEVQERQSAVVVNSATGQYFTRLSATRIGPAGDPFFRYTIRATQGRKFTGKGEICVRANNDEITLNVNGRTIERGTCEAFAPGTYTGKWSGIDKADETIVVKRVFAAASPVRATVRVIGRDGVRKWRTGEMLPGCVAKSPWMYSLPFTPQRVNRVAPTFRNIEEWDSGPGGNFGPLWKGYEVGTSCPTTAN